MKTLVLTLKTRLRLDQIPPVQRFHLARVATSQLISDSPSSLVIVFAIAFQNLFPGLWLDSISVDSYKVLETASKKFEGSCSESCFKNEKLNEIIKEILKEKEEEKEILNGIIVRGNKGKTQSKKRCYEQSDVKKLKICWNFGPKIDYETLLI
ncbi:hypothetical protein R6Q59_034992 [Mikania micrantha]